ncbi:MAG: CBS domain-containing protein [Lysobacterales bacterium]|jgi:CBS domain-containing protein|nr:MAG: CBS domain-containing protein [Xanthomonadales bacterium]
MKVGEYCNREVVTIQPRAGLAEAAEVMRSKHVGFLVVVDDTSPWRRIPIGVLTDRDIVVQVFAPGADVAALSVVDVMTRDPVIASEHDDLGALMTKLREAGVRRAPVVDTEGGLVGVIAMDDAVALVTNLLCDISGLIRQEQRVERRTHPS